jgi:mono/diheme cytochrome c family protein
MIRAFAPWLLAAGLAACGGQTFDKPMQLGGKLIAPEVLDRGKDLYNRYCSTCHGYDGKADTAQARQLDPRPRDLTAGLFKRAAHPNGLPTDDELRLVIVNGIPGTGMPPWPQLEGKDLDAVVHYLKTFATRWQTEAPSGSGDTPKNPPKGSMNVLPDPTDAASFRAAYGGPPDQGSGASNAASTPLTSVAARMPSRTAAPARIVSR